MAEAIAAWAATTHCYRCHAELTGHYNAPVCSRGCDDVTGPYVRELSRGDLVELVLGYQSRLRAVEAERDELRRTLAIQAPGDPK